VSILSPAPGIILPFELHPALSTYKAEFTTQAARWMYSSGSLWLLCKWSLVQLPQLLLWLCWYKWHLWCTFQKILGFKLCIYIEGCREHDKDHMLIQGYPCDMNNSTN